MFHSNHALTIRIYWNLNFSNTNRMLWYVFYLFFIRLYFLLLSISWKMGINLSKSCFYSTKIRCVYSLLFFSQDKSPIHILKQLERRTLIAITKINFKKEVAHERQSYNKCEIYKLIFQTLRPSEATLILRYIIHGICWHLILFRLSLKFLSPSKQLHWSWCFTQCCCTAKFNGNSHVK